MIEITRNSSITILKTTINLNTLKLLNIIIINESEFQAEYATKNEFRFCMKSYTITFPRGKINV